MNIRDRKIKKWAAFKSMPEQWKMLGDMYLDAQRIEKPILDKCEIEAINNHLSESLQNSIPVLFTLYKDGFIENFGPVVVKQVDMIQRRIKVTDKLDYIHFISFDNIVSSEPHF